MGVKQVAGTAKPAMLIGARRGLSSAEAGSRLGAGGRNRVRSPAEPPLHELLRSALTERLVLLLLVVGVVYGVLHDYQDAVIIFAVILAVVGLQTWTGWRATRAVATLSQLSVPRALVWRDRKLTEVPPDELVRDDVIQLSTGSRLPADAVLIQSEELLVDESLVTGESQPVEHRVGEGDVAQLKAGTHVVHGRGVAVVTAVGSDSTLGRVSQMVEEAEARPTPLQKRLEQLARGLLVAAVVVSVLVPAIGVLRGQNLREMVLTGLALAFATIPEGLPILVVVVLGLGSLGLVRIGAIVRRLSGAETLGAVTLVCTDKTGTLTENRISLTSVVTADGVVRSRPSDPDQVDRVKLLARLASEPPAAEDSRLADPIDLAVCRASDADGLDPVARFSFDSARRLASGLVQEDGGLLLGVKGAPEAVLVRAAWWRSTDGVEPLDGELKSRVVASAADLTVGGARVLAVASRTLSSPPDRGGPSGLERELVFEGLLAFSDPLRPEVPGAVRELLGAGVAVTMVTGDQPATATAVARSAGLGGSVFIAAQTKGWSDAELAARTASGCVVARARAEDKLRIVKAAAAAGEIVAVTGDGVNDAPALEAAAVGVAMGRDGSDVAREAADLVLTDDNFATLVRATAEGRRLYENLRKAVRYYLAVKLGLIAVLLVMALAYRPLPFVPVQIVVLELFMDLGASLAFVHQPPEADEMRRRPRDPRGRFLDRQMVTGIVAGGLTLACLTAIVYVLGLLALGLPAARTLALASWLIGQAALAVVLGWERRPIRLPDLAANPAMLIWAGSGLLLALALLASPPLAALLHGGPVPALAALLTVAASAAAPFWLELAKRRR
jgi:Ca2+-transporting ATPase